MKILVMSCDKNSDTFELFHHCIEKYWPDHPEIFYCTETIQNPYYKTITKNYPINIWTKRLRESTQEILDDIILVMVDDLFIQKPVNSALIQSLETYFSKGVVNINFENSFDPNDEFYDNIFLKRSKKSWTCCLTSLMCSMWKKSELLYSAQEDVNPWEYEGSNKHTDGLYLIAKDNPIMDWGWNCLERIHFGVTKNKWTKNAICLAEREHIKLNSTKLFCDTEFTDRGVTINNKAWICFLSTDNYIYFVMHLYRSLLDTKSKYPLYCICTKNINKTTLDILKQLNIRTKIVDNTDETIKNPTEIANWKNALDKLFILKNPFNLEKMVYLDSDLYVYENIDEIMDKPHMSAVIDGAPSNKPCSTPYKLGDSKFCSGLFVWDFKNNPDDASNILNNLVNLPKSNYAWHDQAILNYFYPDWRLNEELHLDPTYGLMTFDSCFDQFDYWKKPSKVIHFIAGQGTKTFIPFTSNPISCGWVKNKELENIIYKYYDTMNDTLDKFDIKTLPRINMKNVHFNNPNKVKPENALPSLDDINWKNFFTKRPEEPKKPKADKNSNTDNSGLPKLSSFMRR